MATLIEKEADHNKESLFYMLRIIDLHNKAEVVTPNQGKPVEIEVTQVARIHQQALKLSRSVIARPMQHVFPVVRLRTDIEKILQRSNQKSVVYVRGYADPRLPGRIADL